MPAKIDTKTCTGCSTCVDVCPSEAITMENKKAKVDEAACIDCESCVDECQSNSISME